MSSWVFIIARPKGRATFLLGMVVRSGFAKCKSRQLLSL